MQKKNPDQVVSFEVVFEVYEEPYIDEHDLADLRRHLEKTAERLGWSGVKVHADDRY